MLCSSKVMKWNHQPGCCLASFYATVDVIFSVPVQSGQGVKIIKPSPPEDNGSLVHHLTCCNFRNALLIPSKKNNLEVDMTSSFYLDLLHYNGYVDFFLGTERVHAHP